MGSNDIIVRIRAVGQQAFSGDMSRITRAIGGVHTAVDATRTKLSSMGQAAERAAGGFGALRGPMLAFGAAAGYGFSQAAAASIDFNKQLDYGKVRIGLFAKNTQEAEAIFAEVRKQQERAPMFDLASMTQATAYMGNAGIAGKKLTKYVQGVTNASIASGLGAEGLERVSRAIGQIAARGTIGAEEINQLSDAGINVRKSLKDAFKLTPKQLKNIGSEGISSSKALDVIIKQFTSGKIQNAAKRALATTAGQIDSFKAKSKIAFGALGRSFYDAFGAQLPKINKALDKVTKWSSDGRMASAMTALSQGFKGQDKGMLTGIAGTMAQIGTVAGKGFRAVTGYVKEFLAAWAPAKPFFQNILLPLLKGVAMGIIGSLLGAFKILIPVIKALAPMLGWIGTRLAPLKGAFEVLGIIIGTLIGPSVLGFAIRIFGKLGLIGKVVAAGLRVMMAPLRILTGLFRGLFSAIRFVLGIASRFAAAIGRGLAKAMPLVIDNAKKLVSGFLRLGHHIVNAIVDGIKTYGPRVLSGAIAFIVDHLPGPNVGGWKGKVKNLVTGRASGGTVRPGEITVVGERGPELARFPGGTQIIPMPRLAPVGAMGNVIHTHVYLRGREIATAVGEDTADRQARRGVR